MAKTSLDRPKANPAAHGRLASFTVHLHCDGQTLVAHFDALSGSSRWGRFAWPPGVQPDVVEASVAEGITNGVLAAWKWSALDLVHLPAPDHASAVRERLIALVEADPRSQKDIAEAARMSPAHLYQLLSGRRVNFAIDSAGSILWALGKRWADLD